ncbi:MAG: AMP-binding protein, partial [Alphaproteobacteria bacterium]
MLNLSSGPRYQAKRDPDRLALVYGDMAVTYGELVRRIDGMAAFLHGRGIGKGDVVGAFMKNSAAFVELGLAVSDLGAILLPMNYRLAAEEAAYIHGDGAVKILFADEEFAP